MRPEAVAAYLSEVEAPAEAGIRAGVAPHSTRACPVEWLEEVGANAERNALVLHIHVDERPREIEECLTEHRCRSR